MMIHEYGFYKSIFPLFLNPESGFLNLFYGSNQTFRTARWRLY